MNRFRTLVFAAGAAVFSFASSVLVAADPVEGPATRATVDEPAVAVKRVFPKYPLTAAPTGGRAQVMVEVDEAGKVISAQVVSATSAQFGESARAAARRWEFRPAMKDGQPVRSWARLPFKFEPSDLAMR